jgi:ubiquinone/menaquinone biosynthesis C-methylase UbiE
MVLERWRRVVDGPAMAVDPFGGARYDSRHEPGSCHLCAAGNSATLNFLQRCCAPRARTGRCPSGIGSRRVKIAGEESMSAKSPGQQVNYGSPRVPANDPAPGSAVSSGEPAAGGLLELAVLERTHPRAAALLRQCLATRQATHVPAILQAYGAERRDFFDHIEAEIGWVLAASDQDLPACLADLQAFNSLTPEAENDAWYDQPAAFTSMHLDALVIGFARRRLECLVRQLGCPGLADAEVLEVGSGCGSLAAMLMAANPAWQLTLVDRSAAAQAYASRYLQARGLAARALCLRGDLMAIPADDNSADIVIAAEVLEHAPDAGQCVAELQRVLRPGGCLAVSVPIDLDIAMHPTVFGSAADITAFFSRLGFMPLLVETVQPDPTLDAIAEVFPGFKGCVHATFRNAPSAGNRAGRNVSRRPSAG